MLYSFFWVVPRRRVKKTYKDGTDRGFRNVGTYNSDARESPKRKNTTIIILLWILPNSVVAYLNIYWLGILTSYSGCLHESFC